MSELRIVSYGGGWQSTALLVLAAQQRIDFRTFVFANVGDDSENPGTVAYVRDHARPYAEANGIELVEVRAMRKGEPETLYERMTRPGSKSLPIPLYGRNGSPMGRACTADFKLVPIGKWLTSRGASEENKATVALGYSADEVKRINPAKAKPYERLVYPLIDLNPPARRDDCARIIRSAGLPVPPKSACWFCPSRRKNGWQEMRRSAPGLFSRAVRLEGDLTTRGSGGYRLTEAGRPLDEVIPAGVDTLPLVGVDDAFGAYGCDGSVCGT
jgi:hypothetical protein